MVMEVRFGSIGQGLGLAWTAVNGRTPMIVRTRVLSSVVEPSSGCIYGDARGKLYRNLYLMAKLRDNALTVRVRVT